MADLSTHAVTVAGTAPTFGAAAAGGDTAEVGDGLVAVYRNANGTTARTVTVAVPGNLETGDAYPDKAYSVPTSGEVWIPLYQLYADPTDRRAHLSYDSEADLTVAVVRA